MGRPGRKWFSQLIEDEERKTLAINRNVKAEDFSTIDPHKIETVVEEEDMEALT
jgi:hypothetical protein